MRHTFLVVTVKNIRMSSQNQSMGITFLDHCIYSKTIRMFTYTARCVEIQELQFLTLLYVASPIM